MKIFNFFWNLINGIPNNPHKKLVEEGTTEVVLPLSKTDVQKVLNDFNIQDSTMLWKSPSSGVITHNNGDKTQFKVLPNANLNYELEFFL